MDATARSMILGSIDGISKSGYGKLEARLKDRFDQVSWRQGAVVIQSVRDHGRLKEVFADIAAAMAPGRYGTLLYVGHGNVACFYFAHGKYVGRRYREPAPPDWWSPGT